MVPYTPLVIFLFVGLLAACAPPGGAAQGVSFKAEVPLSGVMEYNLH